MKEKVNRMLRDKVVLVMLVLGLLTIVAAAGVMTVRRGTGGESEPYLEMPQPELIAQEEGSAAAEEPETAQETEEENRAAAGTAEARNENRADDLAAEAAASAAAGELALHFSPESRMGWPVEGNVLLDYSMDRTIYFPTLEQFKCNPGLVIQSEVSTPVAAAADARVLEVGSNEEIGDYVVLDLGNQYALTCGQLKEIGVVPGEYLKQGQILGYVAEPTKYYSVEGVNVFVELTHEGEAVDPLDFLE